MQLVLQGAYLDFFPDLRAYVERKLAYALIRCRTAVKQATVSLTNRKHPRQGDEWTCAIRLILRDRGRIEARALKSMPSAAIDDALARLSQDVGKKIRPRSAASPETRRR
jgi:ribosome-associated translation inhibitor RaiA